MKGSAGDSPRFATIRGNGWGTYHLTDEVGRSLCGKAVDLRHRSVGLRDDPTVAEPCPDCLVAAVTAGD